jgi:hypothetical protein
MLIWPLAASVPEKGRAAVGGRDCQDRFLDKATDLEFCQFRKLACRSDATAVRQQAVTWQTAAHRPTVGCAKETQTLYSDVTCLSRASDILLPSSASSITSFPLYILSHALCSVQFVRKEEQMHRTSSAPLYCRWRQKYTPERLAGLSYGNAGARIITLLMRKRFFQHSH